VSPTLANFLFESANFLLLAGVLSWVLFKPVRKALDSERAQRTQREQESERVRAEAEALLADNQKARAAAEQESEARRKEVLEQARIEAAALIEQAREAHAREREALQRELDALRASEASKLAEKVGELATQSVGKLLASIGGPSLDTALVRAACTRLAELPPDARKAAQVASARALEPEAKALLEGVLGASVHESIIGELGAGVRVTTPAGQVDASAASLARYAGEAVRATGAIDVTRRGTP